MVFSYLKRASTLTLLSSLTSCAPTSTPIYPPQIDAQNFYLIANVTSNDLSPSINSYVVASYHVGAGKDLAILTPNVNPASGRIFYVNGTSEEVYYGQSNVLSDEGTPPFAAGVSIASSTSNALLINAGVGQAGIGLTRFPDPITELYATGSEGFYACLSPELGGGSAVQIFVQNGNDVPESCARITLLPQCSTEGSGLEHPDGNLINCYADVAGIDWTVYNSD